MKNILLSKLLKWSCVFTLVLCNSLLGASRLTVGPSSSISTDSAVVLWDGTNGYRLKNSVMVYTNDTLYITGNLDITGIHTVEELDVDSLTVSNVTTWNFGTGSTTNDFTVGGNLLTTRGSLTLTNGANNNLVVSKSFYTISGPDGAFSISGLVPTAGGQQIVIANLTGQNMTITYQATSEATNQITTLTGSDLTTTGNGSVELIYDDDSDKWLVIGWQS